MAEITTGMKSQYADSSKLAARARLAREFDTAEVPWFPFVAQHLDVEASASILDVGCGPGWFWSSAIDTLPSALRLTLLDQSQGMVDEALIRCRSLPLAEVRGVVADATAMPFPDESFDAVIAMHMLYHVRDQAKAIVECARVLKPGGMLLVSTNGKDNMRELYRLTTVFGNAPSDPAAEAFGFDRAATLLEEAFGNAELHIHPNALRVTDIDAVFAALTSYPPADTAPPDQQAAFRVALEKAFAQSGGALHVTKQMGVLTSTKPG